MKRWIMIFLLLFAILPVQAQNPFERSSFESGPGTTARAPLHLPEGVAPSSPVNGNIWTTSGGLFVRINGVTLTAVIDLSSPPSIGNTAANTGAFTTLTASGNTSVNTDAISILAASKFVGIGKATPTVPLDVVEDGTSNITALFTNSADGSAIRFSSSGVNASNIRSGSGDTLSIGVFGTAGIFFPVSGSLNLSATGLVTTVKGTLNVDEAVTFDTTLDVTGTTVIGVIDTSNGILITAGSAAASAAGGRFQLQTAADHDTTINAYEIQVNQDDLLLGPLTDTNSLLYSGSLGTWMFTGLDPVIFLDGINLEGDIDLGTGDDIIADGLIVITPGSGKIGLVPATNVLLKQSGEDFFSGLLIQKSATMDTWALAVITNTLFFGYANNASGADAAGDFVSRATLDSAGNFLSAGVLRSDAGDIRTGLTAAGTVGTTTNINQLQFVDATRTTIEGSLHLTETTTPTAIPDAGAIYTKTNNELFFQDGAGVEHLLHGDAFSSMWFHSVSAATLTISTQLIMTKVTAFVNVEDEDDLGNAVSDPTTGNDITIGADGAGKYDIEYGFSGSVVGGASKDLLICPAIIHASPIVVTNATKASPIVITAPGHGQQNGDMFTITGATGDTNVNGDFIASSVSGTNITLVDLAGVNRNTTGGDYGASSASIVREYPGNLVSHTTVSGSANDSVSKIQEHSLAASDMVELYVVNLDGTENVLILAVDLGVNRIGD